jgi:DNA-binding transcriptional MerR regulator
MDSQPTQTTWSTGEVARMLKLSKSTLIRWIALGFLSEPEVIQVGRVRLRVWRREDVINSG